MSFHFSDMIASIPLNLK